MQKPKAVFLFILLLVVFAGIQIPSIHVDTDPENMLPHDQADRVFHDEVKERFALHDMIVVGVVNEEQGIYNVNTLTQIQQLSASIQKMEGVVQQDLMSLDTVDSISQVEGEPGTIRFQWMMKTIPTSDEALSELQQAVKRLPLLNNTLVSEDQQAAAIYIPITAKSESYRLSNEIQQVVDQIKAEQVDASTEFYMAGLPVAEDTFGVEMFIQMAISAPLAGLMIFVLMWVFFRSFLLITAPMLVAMASVIITMGLLIGQGYTVHIMSSMIPIFLMPIAVVDSVHLLSEFADRYKPGQKPQKALKAVIGHLFTPMLYTSITSAAGFASLALTPIPPVQIFGLHVAVGILLAFLLTITLVPAYIVSLSDKRLAALKDHSIAENDSGKIGRLLAGVGRLSISKSKALIIIFAGVSVLSAYGLSTIQINDNPVRWFKEDHRLRVADEVMNHHFPGTYDAFLVFEHEDAQQGMKLLESDLVASVPDVKAVETLKKLLIETTELPQNERLQALAFGLDDLAYEQPESETLWLSLLEDVEAFQANASYFLSPEALIYLDEMQTALDQSEWVGKSNSFATLLKTVYRELQGGDESQFRLPPTREAAAQTILSFQSSHRPDDLWHMVTPDYSSTALWLQLKSGDNQDMSKVIALVDQYVADNPLPEGLSMRWAGLTFINVVWQEQMVSGMLDSLISAFFMVLLMMLILFRSIRIGLLAMLPLSFTVLFIYGLIGFVGKDYDMPIAVLSALTLGLSVDFAIHFLERCRAIYRECGDWDQTIAEVYQGPARAISRNAVVVAIGFTPLLFAPLVPYITVGFFLALIMAVSALVTVILLPALIHNIRNKQALFGQQKAPVEEDAYA